MAKREPDPERAYAAVRRRLGRYPKISRATIAKKPPPGRRLADAKKISLHEKIGNFKLEFFLMFA